MQHTHSSSPWDKELEQLVVLLKNWPDDPREGCAHLVASLEDFCDAKSELIELLEDEFKEEIGRLVEDYVGDVDI